MTFRTTRSLPILLQIFVASILYTDAFFKKEENYLNGHKYAVIIDQPFFRVNHEPHTPVGILHFPVSNIENSTEEHYYFQKKMSIS